jgi:hypothetical protein
MKKPDFTYQKKLEELAMEYKKRKEQKIRSDSSLNAIVRK